MIALVALLLAVPLGLLCRSVAAARATFAVAYLWAFGFQTLYLLLESLEPGVTDPAFAVGSFPAAYGVVTLVVLAVGLVLVEAGHRLRERRHARTPVPATA